MSGLGRAYATVLAVAPGPLGPPDFGQGAKDAPWADKLAHLSNVAALVLVLMGLLSLLVGTAVAALGPRLGFHRAGEVGRGGIIGGLACGALAASGWALINGAVAMFS
jgi:hypothetical protein